MTDQNLNNISELLGSLTLAESEPTCVQRELRNHDQLWNAILRVHGASCGSSDLDIEQQSDDIAWLRRRLVQWCDAPEEYKKNPRYERVRLGYLFDDLVKQIVETVIAEWEASVENYIAQGHMEKVGDKYQWAKR